MNIKNLLMSIFVLPFVGLMSLLTGCGGGGGGVTGGISFVKWSDITPPATVNIDGISTDADYVAPAPDYTVTDVVDEGFSTNASASITYRSDGSISKISITTPNGTVSWDERAGDLIDESVPEFIATSNAAATSFGIAADPIENMWEYQTFGAWETGRGTGSGTLGAISIGAPTPGNAIPTENDATFAGYTVGAYLDPTGETDYITSSILSVQANFVDRELAFTSTGTQKTETATGTTSNAIELNMTGTLTYAAGTNSFSGDLTAVGGMTGQALGRFYGPNAEELGGVFSLRGEEGTVEAYGGAFGAKR